MPLPLIPLAVVTLGGLVLYKKTADDNARSTVGAEPNTAGTALSRPSGLTAERQAVYEVALNHVGEPGKLLALADAFATEGLHAQANMLRKRAKLRAMPKELRKARRAAFKAALSSKDKDAVLKVAKAFHAEGASGSALALYKYADGLSA